MGLDKQTCRGLIEQRGTTIDNYIQLLLLTWHHSGYTVSYPYCDFNLVLFYLTLLDSLWRNKTIMGLIVN